MRVRFLINARIGKQVYKAGEAVDMDNRLAGTLIWAKVVEGATETMMLEAPNNAMLKTKRARRAG